MLHSKNSGNQTRLQRPPSHKEYGAPKGGFRGQSVPTVSDADKQVMLQKLKSAKKHF
jgi:hypothetical protein